MKSITEKVPTNKNEIKAVMIEKLYKPCKIGAGAINMLMDMYYKNGFYLGCKIVDHFHENNNIKRSRFNIKYNNDTFKCLNLNVIPCRIYSMVKLYYRDPIYDIIDVLSNKEYCNILHDRKIINNINAVRTVIIFTYIFI